MNTRINSGMLLCYKEEANQMQDEKTASCNGNELCGLWFFISYLIGHHTIKLSRSNQSVHGFWIRTVITFVYLLKLNQTYILACNRTEQS